MSLNDINSLSHTKWNCKYHIVFAPKYRRKVFYQEKRLAVGKDIETIVRMERSKDNRGRSVSRSCAYVGRDTTENVSIKFHGILEREEQHNAI